MTELEQGLLEWSATRHDWQKDLLRRLAGGERLSSLDIRAYATAAERMELSRPAPWRNAPVLDELPNFVGLDASHLTATVVGGDPVKLVQIVHIEGANNLAPGAEVTFNPAGLTIIAGKNGSGKSGYTRILKQVAASRGSESVLPNAFNPQVVPSAVVKYQVGSALEQELTWIADVDPRESPLQRVRVFDARAASVQLAGSTEIAYVPPVLQVLGEYTTALQAIAEVIENDLETLRLTARSWPELEIGPGKDIFDNLGNADSLSALDAVQSLSEAEQAELDALPGRLQELATRNPATLAVQARQRSNQLNALARNLEAIAEKLAPDALSASISLRSALGAAKAASAESKKEIETGSLRGDVGNDKWKAMWIAAQEYAPVEHFEHEAPDVEFEASCPLCQQELDEGARGRFARYSAFMQGEAELALQAATTIRNADVEALKALPLDSLITQDLIELVKTYSEALGDALLPIIASAEIARDELIAEADAGQSKVDAEKLGTELAAVIDSLRESADLETGTANELTSSEPTGILAAQLAERLSLLTVRKGLASHLTAIADQHDLSITIAALASAKSACDTTGASRKNSELSRGYVERVCHSFEAESRSLGLARVPVELAFDRTSRGVSYVKVTLKGAPSVPVATVLSEGEQRVTAIAGFFADLTESGDSSTLVFDDPVSSLDQEFRVLVARRLLQEAEGRQVLVYTHDFSFVQYLYEEKSLMDRVRARDGAGPGQEISYIHIDRTSAGAGVVTTSEQWRHVGVKERIGRLKQRIQSAGVLYRDGDTAAYEREARDIVGALRDTWEAFVEQELLNGVVTRHERGVHTQRLALITDLGERDVAAVDIGMSVESRYMTGHAAPVSDASALEGPDWLFGEVTQLETFRAAIRQRR